MSGLLAAIRYSATAILEWNPMENKSLLPLLRRWWRLLFAGAVIGGCAGYFVASTSAPTYESDVKMLVGPVNTDYDSLRAAGQLGRSYAELATSRPVLSYAIRRTGARTTPRALSEQDAVRTTSNDITRIVEISVRHGDASTAADLANALARRIRQLARATPPQLTATARTLMEQPEIARLPAVTHDAVGTAARRVLNPSIAGLVNVFDPAEPAAQPVAPRISLITILAAFMGLLAVGVIVVLRESSTHELADERSLRARETPAFLGAVAAPSPRRGSFPLAVDAGPHTTAEGYRAIATKLGLFDSELGVRSLLVLGASSGRRGGVVAANLAGVLAEAGRRVLLLDANAAGGGATTALALEGRPGYGELLATMSNGRLNGTLEQLTIAHSEDLLVLPRGTLPGLTMLDVDRAELLIDRLDREADLVIVSAAPVQAPPTALVWSRVTEGTVVVVDHNVTTEDRLNDTLDSLRFSGAKLIGTVLGRRGRLAATKVA
jgi:Mrp family chromosome partitioning ATPase/capsular polysaccharide biosynthesis protein